MDRFEQYLKENRLRLDTEDLEPDCWNAIADSFKQHKRRSTFRKLYVAASIVVVLGLISVIFLNKVNKTEQVVQSTLFPASFYDLSKQETSYLQVINMKVDEIKKQRIPAEYKNLFGDFIQQLQLIDQQYDLYKSQIEQHGYNEELIQQVIYNYQLKLSVLQMLQAEINKINNLSKNDKNENKNIQLNI